MKKLSILLVIIWMIIIFIFSNQPAIESSKESDKIYNFINTIIPIKEENSSIVTNIIRKSAHLFLYFILGILVIHMCHYYKTKDLLLLAVLICLTYSLTDEIHQLFVIGRSGEVRDVLIDMIGSLLGIYLYNIIYKKEGRKKWL